MNFSNNFQINILVIILLLSSLISTAVFNSLSVIFILKILYEIIKNKELNFFNQNWIKLTFIFYVVINISSFNSEYLNDIFIKNILLIRFLLLALCVQYCFQKFKNVNLFLYTITIMTLFVAIDSMIQYFFGTNLFGNNLNDETISRIRLTGIFGDEEIIGAYLIKFICLGTVGCFILFKQNKIISYIYFSLVSSAILFSQERMAFILLLFLVCLIFFHEVIKMKFKNVVILSVVALIFISLAFKFDKSLQTRYLSIFTSGSGIAKVKYDDDNKPINFIKSFSDLKKTEISFKDSIWGAHFITAYEIFKNNYLLGSGPRSFRYECGLKKYENIDIHYINKRCSTHPHNFYLEILSETGLIGFIFFIFLLILFYFNQFKYFLNNKNYKHLFGLLTIFLNLWPVASTGSIYASFNGLIIWITIGYVLSFSNYNLKSL